MGVRVYRLPKNEWFCQTASSLQERISKKKTPLDRFLSLSLSLPLFDFGASQDIRSPYTLLEVITNTADHRPFWTSADGKSKREYSSGGDEDTRR